MDQTNIGSKFYTSLLQFLLSAKQHIVEIGNDHGLSSIQAITLLILEENVACPMKKLGQLFHCDASNVTGIIDGLENKGLVMRVSDPKDRRIKTIAICPAGKKMQKTILNQLSCNNGFLFDPLTADEAKQFIHIMAKLAPTKKPADC